MNSQSNPISKTTEHTFAFSNVSLLCPWLDKKCDRLLVLVPRAEPFKFFSLLLIGRFWAAIFTDFG